MVGLSKGSPVKLHEASHHVTFAAKDLEANVPRVGVHHAHVSAQSTKMVGVLTEVYHSLEGS